MMNEKVAYCIYVICWIVAGFYGKHEALQQVLMLLWAFDTITWIIRYFRLGKLRSRSIWYGTLSKALLLIIPLSIHMASESVSVGSGDVITSIVFWTLCIAEFISIIQNIQVARTGVDITEQDAVSKVLNGILWGMNRLLDHTIGKFQNFK